MINLNKISAQRLQTYPYAWAEIDELYSPDDAAALAATYPRDHFKTVSGYGGEKNYEYEARQLIAMDTQQVVNPQTLSPQWLKLAQSLCSQTYRQTMSTLTGLDLNQAPMEVNVFHYGPGANLGPHPDLADKLVTHILYFNEYWDPAEGGCLHILGSSAPNDIVAEVIPIVGNSAILVRAENSWHAVSQVVNTCRSSRRSLTVTFYCSAASSSMWPANDRTSLHSYDEKANQQMFQEADTHG